MFFFSNCLTRPVVASIFFIAFSSANANEKCPQTIYQAKEIVTLESGWPSAKYVLVKGDSIRATANTLAELKDYHVPSECLDKTFKDKVIVPGFIEAHSHMLLGGLIANLPKIYPNAISHADGSTFDGISRPEQAIELIKYYVERFNNPNETLIVWGWDVLTMGGLHLDKHILNEISSTQPLLVWDSSEHFFYANDAAMQKANITEKDLSIPGAISIDKGFTGQFLGPKAGVRILADASHKMLSADFALPRMQSVLDLSAKNGITTTSEMAMGVFHFQAETFLNKKLMAGQPITRVVATPLVPSLLNHHSQDEAIAWVKTQQEKSNNYLIYRGVKFLFDDSFLGLSMMEEQYLDNRHGLYVMQPGDEVFNALRPWWQSNVQIHIHTNGTAANEALAETMAQLQLELPRFEPNLVIEHVGMTTPRIIERVENLGAMASVNPYYLYYRSDINNKFLGADRSAKAARLKTMHDSGMTVSLHSDSPIGPPIPLEWMWIATNRQSLSGEIKAPNERVSNATALKMITLNAAKTLGIDDKVGSIEAGKLADFTILDKNPLTVKKEQLRDIKVWGTVLGGRVIKASDIKADLSLVESRMPVDLTQLKVSQASKELWREWQVKAKHRQAGFSF